MPKSLKDARKNGDLEGFIKEHERDARGDLDKLEQVIAKPALAPGSASKAPKTSRRASSDD